MRARDLWKKERETDYPIHRLMEERWSPVVYSDEPVEEEKLQILFEAARWAPSCYNEQPWSFYLGEGVLDCLVDANRAWAQYAPVLGISVAHLKFAKNGKPNRHAHHDVGLAMGALILQAVDLDLSVHQMAGFSVEKARELLGLDEDHDPVAAFAIGYRADPKSLPDLTERELTVGSRKKQGEFLFRL